MGIKLKLLKKLKGGVKVWLVDGDLVRQKYYNDFIEGGHDKVYKWMPSKEIWIDDKLPAKNREAVILHEDHERHLMSHGMTYDKAHRSSSIVEGEAKAHHKVAERLKQEETMKKNPGESWHTDRDKRLRESFEGGGKGNVPLWNRIKENELALEFSRTWKIKNPRKALAVTLIPRLIPENEENPKGKLIHPKCRGCGKSIDIYASPEEIKYGAQIGFRCEECTDKWLSRMYGSKKGKNPDKFGKLTPSELAGMTPYGMYDPAPREKKSSSGDGWGGLLTLIVIGSVVGVVMYFAKKADNPTPPGPTY